jgi:mRNA-degrading endonuclease YafQ of YafQ-DinJ toxin-antitoxin module
MTRIVLSSKFKRSFRKFVRRDASLQVKIQSAIEQMSVDFCDPILATHKLDGKLAGLMSCSCGYDCRIVFTIEEEDGEKFLLLLNVGTHDEVY